MAGFGAAAPSPWEKKFWLMLSFSSRQLKAFRRYIKLNPARALWKARKLSNNRTIHSIGLIIDSMKSISSFRNSPVMGDILLEGK